MQRFDVAIIGAGPYGLSAAAHLRQLKGLEIKIFGEPMSFWERHMPGGMFLRSPWDGSHIADPEKRLTLSVYRTVNGNHRLADPVPLKDFIEYGQWFYEQVGLPADRRKVMRIDLASEGYQLNLEDGEAVRARRVVVAGGIEPFAYRPAPFRYLPSCLVTHTSESTDFGRFRGKEVLVIGGGQSALETAVFLREAGAEVEVLIRNSPLYWLDHRQWMRSKPFRWMFYGPGEIGPAGASLAIERPNLFRWLPERLQSHWGARAMRPAVSRWLKPRANGLPIHVGACAIQARVEGERLRVRFSDGREHPVDHVFLGTGYRLNVALYPFLSAEVLKRIDIVDGYPRLDAGLETSLRGLHFLGAAAARSFGPLMRFVAGTKFASLALKNRIGRAQKGRLASLPSARARDTGPSTHGILSR